MILFCVGLPGRFGVWCEAVVTRLAQFRGGPTALLTWPPGGVLFGFDAAPPVLEEIGLRLIQDGPRSLVVGIRQPDEPLFAALSSTGSGFVVALDDPRAAAPEVLADAGDLGAAIRAIANACPLMLRFASLPGALALRADQARRNPRDTIAAIAAHLGLSPTDAQLIQIERDVAAAGYGCSAADEPLAGLAESAARAIDGALAGYAAEFEGGNLGGQLVWNRELFILFDDGNRRATGAIEIAGPPRPLIYGPYIHLPFGEWTARVTIGFSAETVGKTFVIDAFADPVHLAQAVLVPSKGGIFSADLEFSLTVPTARGVEIRVMLASSNARGQIAFGHVVLKPRRVGAVESSASADDFERALEL